MSRGVNPTGALRLALTSCPPVRVDPPSHGRLHEFSKSQQLPSHLIIKKYNYDSSKVITKPSLLLLGKEVEPNRTMLPAAAIEIRKEKG